VVCPFLLVLNIRGISSSLNALSDVSGERD
jgi:hypothetical protein